MIASSAPTGPEPTSPEPSVAQPVRIAYLFSDGNLPGTLKAFKALLQERPDLRGRVALTFLTESMFDDVKADEIIARQRARAGHDEPADARALQRDAQDRPHRAACAAHGKVFARRRRPAAEGDLHQARARSGTTARARYWAHSGFANQVGLLKYALTQAGVTGLSLPKPQPSLDFGYYYPDGRDRAGLRDVGRVRRLAAGSTASCVPARRASQSASTSRRTTPARPSCSTR